MPSSNALELPRRTHWERRRRLSVPARPVGRTPPGFIVASAVFCIPCVGLNEEQSRSVLFNSNLQTPQNFPFGGWQSRGS
jgi:hypothetical protein